MPTPMYMTVPGVPGSVAIAGRIDQIEIIELEHLVHLPVDIHTGRSSGVRQHGIMSVHASIDKATPLLYKAVTEGNQFALITLHFYRINDLGVEENYYTVELARVRVTSIELIVPNVKDTGNEHLPHMVKYGFVYGALTETFVDGAIGHTDDWLAAR
jgi:type VI secretion system secreted protein Hcp